jgi:hypothetical protein
MRYLYFKDLDIGLRMLPFKMYGTKCLWICYSLDVIYGAIQFQLQVV